MPWVRRWNEQTHRHEEHFVSEVWLGSDNTEIPDIDWDYAGDDGYSFYALILATIRWTRTAKPGTPMPKEQIRNNARKITQERLAKKSA